MLKNNKNKLKTKPKRLLEPSQILFCSILKLEKGWKGWRIRLVGRLERLEKTIVFK